MRKIFCDENNEKQFREDGYVVFDLLDADAIADLLSFYATAFPTRREVVPYARELPYYISIFDRDASHKREVDERISSYVARDIDAQLENYEVFYSNFMIKFPGDGQIEAHQDFNFVDESHDTAFNLWCPLVDTDSQNGGLYVIAGSHNIFLTQRGPNLAEGADPIQRPAEALRTLCPVEEGPGDRF